MVGVDAIAADVGAGGSDGSTISWGPDNVIVAASGDLGVSIGVIKVTSPATASAPAQIRNQPFFTIWKRATTGDPWRYIAE